MSALRGVRRLMSMERRELAFRLASETRKRAGQLRVATVAPKWDRRVFPSLLVTGGREGRNLHDCRDAAARGDWLHAHEALASHITSANRAFPLDCRALPALAAHIAARVPNAREEARAAGERLLEGSYDLLGYRDLAFGSPPRWHHDPVHERTAPPGFWASIQYLDPACGDHKIIWELNRHQHFLALGRAFHVTGDRRYYNEFVRQLDDWLRANPPLQGINWCSMLELAFRALSWLWALHLFAPAATAADETPWTIDLLVALDRQLTHIDENLSRYFSPNTHLTGEALALYVAGLALPELRASAHRVSTGGDVLVEEATRQVRTDGGHAELSAHYHRYSTDFYLLAAQVARAAGDLRAEALTRSATRQSEFLRIIADDNGALPLTGDDDGGQLFPMCGVTPRDARATLAYAAVLLDRPHLQIAAIPEEVYWLCGTRLAPGDLDGRQPGAVHRDAVALTDSGYYVMRGAPGDHLLFDAGPHGFLNGGHAHSDALSMVLSVGGLPVFVDPGTATYTMDPTLRDLFRSTAMHNTVVLDERAQSVPRGPFHWESRVDARGQAWHADARVTYAEGVHEGYAPTVHVRGVLAVRGVGWLVIDHLLGTDRHLVDTYWHLHPEWSASRIGSAGLRLTHVSGRTLTIASSTPLEELRGDAAAGLHLYAPEYGRIEQASVLRARVETPLPFSMATFIPASPGHAAVEPIAVTRRLPSTWHAAAFRVSASDVEGELLCAVNWSPSVRGDRDYEGPGALWGTDRIDTDARVALVPRAGAAIIIHGTVAGSALASTVHQP